MTPEVGKGKEAGRTLDINPAGSLAPRVGLDSFGTRRTMHVYIVLE